MVDKKISHSVNILITCTYNLSYLDKGRHYFINNYQGMSEVIAINKLHKTMLYKQTYTSM